MMKLALTPEADSVNVQALDMGHIVVNIDGVELTELINKVAEYGYSLRVVDDPDQQSTCTPPPFTTLRGCMTISDCESWIIFDNNEDKTDSAALLPCIEQAREDVRTLRHLQLIHLSA